MPLVSHNCPSCAAPLTGPGPVLVCAHCGNEFSLADQPAAPVFAPPLSTASRPHRQRFARLRKLSLAARLSLLGGLVVGLVFGLLVLRAYASGHIWQYRVINDAALSPDGKRLASVHGQGFSVKGSLRIWDAATGQLLQRLDGLDTPMWVVKWSPDGRWIATGGHEGSIQLWDTTTWQPLSRLAGASGFIKYIAWSPDSQRIATGDANGILLIWDAASGKTLSKSPLHSKDIDAVAWSPDGKYIATGGWDKTVIIFDVTSGKLLYKFSDKSYVTCLAWSPDSRWLATGGLSNLVLVFDVTSGTQQRSFDGPKSAITNLGWSPDGKLLAAVDNGHTARVWEVATGTPLHVLDNEGYDASLAWSPDGKQLASGSSGLVRVWDVASGQLHKLTGHERETKIDIIGWSADGTQLFTLGNYDVTMRVWDLTAQKELRVMKVSLTEALQNTLF